MIGKHPWRAGVREKTGCQIVAIDRADEVHVEFNTDFTITRGDLLYVCGAAKALDRYFSVHKAGTAS